MIDTHIHSHFSHDSNTKILDYVKKAIEIGLKGITITDHLDHHLFVDGIEPYNFDKNLYVRELNEIKQLITKTNPDFKFLIGIEEGFKPEVLDLIKYDIEIIKPDFVISSAHLVNDIDIYLPSFYHNRTKEKTYKEYLQYIIKNVEMFDDFDAIGHIGYICRYAPYDDTSLNYTDFKIEFDKLFELLIKKEKALEINTSGYKSINQSLPNFSIIEAYINAGGKLLTFGSDSHIPDTLGMQFENLAQFVKKCGLNYITYFKNRKPYFDEI